MGSAREEKRRIRRHGRVKDTVFSHCGGTSTNVFTLKFKRKGVELSAKLDGYK